MFKYQQQVIVVNLDNPPKLSDKSLGMKRRRLNLIGFVIRSGTKVTYIKTYADANYASVESIYSTSEVMDYKEYKQLKESTKYLHQWLNS